MKLLILGGSNCQINAVIKAKQKGHTVIVSDYLADAPAKELADYGEIVSTFDIEGNIEVAHKYGVGGVLTLGTDQPVYSIARVADELGLPRFLDVATAKAVTNKKVMKSTFNDYGIPTARFKILAENFKDSELSDLKFPIVIKPLDSQGQRGVYKMDKVEEIRERFKTVLSYSREKVILAEEFYESDEITLSGWVRDGRTYILTITDRITYNNFPHIGICTAHEFPSKYCKPLYQEIKELTEKIVEAFGIHNGPIYFQMFIGTEGIKVNEIACRIGGAYEDELIPLITGVDILDMLIDGAAGSKIDFTDLEKHHCSHSEKFASVQMIFTRPGKIKMMTEINRLRQLAGVKYARYNMKPGCSIKEITDATQRVGYMIVQGKNLDMLKSNIDAAFNELKICDEKMVNMLIRFPGGC